MLQAGDGARSDARSAFEILGRDARQRGADDMIAGPFPSIARNTQHGRFAGAGIAHHDCQIALARYVAQRGLLLRSEYEPLTSGGSDRPSDHCRRETMPRSIGEPIRGALQSLLGFDHSATGKALLTPTILPERDHRSEGRRVGKGCVSPGKSRWSPYQ